MLSVPKVERRVVKVLLVVVHKMMMIIMKKSSKIAQRTINYNNEDLLSQLSWSLLSKLLNLFQLKMTTMSQLLMQS